MPEHYNYTVLFAEDQIETANNYIAFLKKYFRTIYEAKNGIQALIKYEEYAPDIVVLDVNMPKMNGMEVLKKIRATDKQTRVIMFSAHNEQHYLKEAKALGITYYLIKPASRTELKSALIKAIEELKSLDTDDINVEEWILL